MPRVTPFTKWTVNCPTAGRDNKQIFCGDIAHLTEEHCQRLRDGLSQRSLGRCNARPARGDAPTARSRLTGVEMFNWFKREKAAAAQAGRLPTPKDDYDRAILGDIARVGWSVIQIDPNDPETDPPSRPFSLRRNDPVSFRRGQTSVTLTASDHIDRPSALTASTRK
jgi:hypothetical protein